jgi:carboxylesterase type B
MSEDCLFLNVWTTFVPKNFEQGRRRPVVILIEGSISLLN